MENVIISILLVALAISVYFNWKNSRKLKMGGGDSWELTISDTDPNQEESKKAGKPILTLNGIVGEEYLVYTGYISTVELGIVRIVPKPPPTPIHPNPDFDRMSAVLRVKTGKGR
ncbi:MAG: hypothetical protein V4722_10755 [Bacteroidota bacterium]